MLGITDQVQCNCFLKEGRVLNSRIVAERLSRYVDHDLRDLIAHFSLHTSHDFDECSRTLLQ